MSHDFSNDRRINIFNADCLEKMKDIKDKSISLIFTDLPWNATSCKWDCLIDLDLMWKEFKRVRKDTTPIVFCCSTKFGYSLIESNKKEFRYDMVWVKSSNLGFLNSSRMPMKKHEMVYIFYKKCPTETYGNNIKKYHKQKFIDKEETKDSDSVYGDVKIKPPKTSGSRYETPLPNSVLEITSRRGKHSTMKPTELSDFFIKYYSNENDLVLDCCMGLASTGISCIKLNRRFIGIEKDKEIFKLAQERLKNKK
jgi:site-specific DNA-methyltransferase (adenine-specific)